MPRARTRGKHRKPSTVNRLSAVGAVGAGTVAASVLAPAAAAHAASDSQWERVANCESGDRWHIDTGNGYYGGLQFSASTWTSFDVNNYASRADLASRGEQIDVANRVLDAQGWGAWPVCSQYRGEPGPAEIRHTHHSHHGQPQSAHKVLGPAHWVTYVVKAGDTLSKIARHHNVKGGWEALYQHNRHRIGANPSVIHAGMTLSVLAR
jgi:hypothetical protein